MRVRAPYCDLQQSSGLCNHEVAVSDSQKADAVFGARIIRALQDSGVTTFYLMRGRMNRRLGSVAVLLLSTVVLGCRDLAKPRNLSSVSITLERTPCYGACTSYVVTLHGNGTVEYLGKSRVDIPGLQTSTVEPRRILDLLQAFKEIHFFELQDHYFEDCTDLPTAIVTLREDGRFKLVSNYYGGCGRKTSGPQVQLARLSEQLSPSTSRRS
jgi:Domain of unknown function (DUF6438)